MPSTGCRHTITTTTWAFAVSASWWTYRWLSKSNRTRLTCDREDVNVVRSDYHREPQTSSPNDSKLFPSRFDFFFGAFLTLSPSLPLSSPSVTIRRLSLLELVLDLACEDEKDRLGVACFDLAAPFEGCFLLSCFVDSSSEVGRGGSPFSISRTYERGQRKWDTQRRDLSVFRSPLPVR